MSLRARLVLVLAVLMTVGLLVAGIITYTSLRSFLVDRVDRTVAGSTAALADSLVRRGSLDPTDVVQLASSTPGVFIGLIDQSGAVTWSPIGARPGEVAPPQPQLPSPPPQVGDHAATTITVGAVHGDTRYRARLQGLPQGETLVVAAPLGDVDATLHQLLLIELLVSAAVVAVTVGIGLWLIRISLRPLGRIEQTAAAIAAGDLSQRIPNTDERTEVGRLGRALNAMLGQIEQAFAERTASEQRLRRFVGDASHELRTPLASVQAYAELFERGARDHPDDLARAMAGIEREAKRMGVLVDDLLLLARLDQGRPLERQPVDLSELASEAVEVAHTLEPARPLELVAPEPVTVIGDPARLRQVLDNLLANVRAHTPLAARATVRVGSDNGSALIEVIDDGPGLTDDQAAHLFERFYRGDPSRSRDGGGTGLGLAIVAAIVQAHGGTASAGPGETGGTTFRVSLPVDGSPAAA